MEVQNQFIVVQGHVDTSGDAVHFQQLYQAIFHADSGHTYDTKALYRHTAGILCNDFIINDNISHMGIHRRTFHTEPPLYSDQLFLPISPAGFSRTQTYINVF